MNSSSDRYPLHKSNQLFSWEFVALKLMLLVLLGVLLEQPSGSIAGRLALQQEGFNLYSYNMKQHHVYAIAIGPRGGASVERGVWVDHDGTFKIANLPVGEYELKVHVPGFATSYDSGIFVEDGKTTKLTHDVSLELEQPSVNMGSTRHVFARNEAPSFWINANECSDATVKVYRRDLLQMEFEPDATKKHGFVIGNDLSTYKPYDDVTKTTAVQYFASEKPVREWHRVIGDEQGYQAFKFSQPLPPGDYFAVAEVHNVQNKSDWNVMWFTVTDIGLIVKQDPWQTVVRAVDLTTLKPVPGVQVKLFDADSNGKVLASGTTGGDGFISIAHATPIGTSVNNLVSGTYGDCHAYGGLNYYSNNGSDQFTTMFYTDRPVYRLGQTVYFKGIVRERARNGLNNPGGNRKIRITIEDPDNNKLKTFKVISTDHGTFNGIFDIPQTGKTGAYQAVIDMPGATSDYERFEVAEYRKPEYQVEVQPFSPRITAGSKARARIKATYYFGGPVANAKVKYTIFSSADWRTRYSLMDRPDYYSYFDGWDNDDDYADTSYAGEYVSEGYTATDSNGEAIVEFDTKRQLFDRSHPWQYDSTDRDYKVEAEVTDISRLSVIGDGHVTVTNGDFEIFTKADSYIAKVGDNIGAEVRLVSYDSGHPPVANQPVSLRLYRQVYDRNHGVFKGIEVFEDKNAVTDANGKVHVSFATKAQFPTDSYEILCTAEDKYNNVIADEASVWVVSDATPYQLPEQEAQKEPLTLKLNKDVYKPGETARVLITAPVHGNEGGQAIVSVEGDRLYNYQVVNLQATATMVELPVTAEYAPNVYVTVTFVDKKHQFYNESKIIKVSPKQHFLSVSVDTDKQKYRPGDDVTYTITARYADGKPAADTELSLGVVDESIYAIRPDTTPDIRSFFYNRRPNSVSTICSFPEENSGGPDKIEPRLRKDFRDTAAWVPVLTTDAQGVARTVVKLPDNLTTWRATVVAINSGTEVGMTRQKIISTQDLILRLAMPRFFSQGDEGYVTAVVNNFTDIPQPVELTLSPIDQFQIKTGLKQKIVVEPQKAARYSWPVTVASAGNADIKCKAVGSTAGDAMETHVPIRPLGVESFVTRSGVITAEDASAIIPAQLPADALAGTAKLDVYLSSSSIGSLVGSFSSLIDYPYGCTEQTMSRLMPSVVAVRLNQSLGVPLTDADRKKFKDVYKQAMDKLNGYQHDDGGWGWWSNDSSQLYLTALVLDGYRLLQDAHYGVPADRRDKGLQYLQTGVAELVKQLNDPLLQKNADTYGDKAIDLSKAVCVLSVYKRPLPPATIAWLLQHRSIMTPETLAYATIAFHNAGLDEQAHTMYARLLELANQTASDAGATTDWGPSKQMFEKLGHRDWWWYSYRYTDVETTALALQAVTRMEPDNNDRMENIKRWIMLQRSKDGWSNTKTTAEVFRALMDVELSNRGNGTATDYAVDFPDAPSVTALHFDATNQFQQETDLKLAPKTSGTYTLHKRGHGRLYYTSILTYYKRIQPGQYVAAKSMPDGLKMRREFFRLKPSAPDSNGTVHFTAQPLGNAPVRAGETLLMKVYVEAPSDLPYVILEAPLPSGAEVVQNDSREDAAEDRSAQDNSDNSQQEDAYPFGQMWWSHQDLMDDHLAFFVTDMSRGKAEIHQMVRMEIPGRFEMNPVTLQGMYTKNVRAYSQADEIKVVE